MFKKINLDSINDQYGLHIGLIFIVSICFVIINFLIWLFQFLNRKIRYAKYKSILLNRFKSLDFHEKSVIREFFLKNQSSLEVPLDDSIITGLLRKKILVINKQFSNGFIINGSYATVSINQLIEPKINLQDIDFILYPSPDQISFMKSNRPQWADNMIY
ncbi:MAG: superinfection exclusion B family protein [Flavobacteriaceae bacterium]|nr:superinfection exclusion B family protein [Flavobacteriaceae bacterium]